jgi:hypothetical protein
MGLDQYLYAKNYLSPMEWRGQETVDKFNEIADAIKVRDFMDTELPSIQCVVKVGYWRKANAIHQWFVDHCQNGEDDCREAYVSREQLTELRDLCQTIIDFPDTAEEELPTSVGFFFGSQEYDEWYFQDLKLTVEIIDNVLAKVPDGWDFAYGSSW